MNKGLLQAVVSTLEDIQSIRNRISDINGENLPGRAKLLLQSVFTRCDAIDAVLEEALAGSCNLSSNMLPIEEDEVDDRDVVLSRVLR